MAHNGQYSLNNNFGLTSPTYMETKKHMPENTPLGMQNITQNFHNSNLIIVITDYLILTSISLTRIIHATCTYQLKLRVCTTNSYKVITHHYICNKFTVNETSSQTAQSLNSASISPQPENMKLGGSELNSSVRREKKI